MTTSAVAAAMRRLALALILLCGLAPLAAHAQNQAPSESSREAERQAAWKAGVQAGTKGPAEIKLRDQAVLAVPADNFFIPKTEAARIMRALGNTINEDTFDGIVIGTRQSDDWIVVVRYIKEGYIKDDEAKDWNADELLQNLKDGTEGANKDRAARGFAELEVLGWVEKPTYDAATHRLVWSLLSKHKGEPDSATKGINYNTYALGREGYFSLNLLTNSQRIDADKPAAQTLLAALTYNDGKRYEDFVPATDHIAAYGIAALVGGIAAKKLGLIALAGAFVLKFAKIIGIGIAALVGGFWRLLGRRRDA
jgi:uncharacterized membrane-anchored protein